MWQSLVPLACCALRLLIRPPGKSIARAPLSFNRRGPTVGIPAGGGAKQQAAGRHRPRATIGVRPGKRTISETVTVLQFAVLILSV
jgi:hypothetical protein